MTDTTTTRPLPTTMAELRAHYFPPAPTDTAVTRSLAGIGRIDALIAAAHTQLEQLDQADRDAAIALADAALDGRPLEPLAARLTPGDRATAVHRLEQLHRARSVADHRHTVAQREDEQHLAWKAACENLTREWQIAMNAESTEDRFAGLVSFASRH